jgi:hypothetical protein
MAGVTKNEERIAQRNREALDKALERYGSITAKMRFEVKTGSRRSGVPGCYTWLRDFHIMIEARSAADLVAAFDRMVKAAMQMLESKQ